MSNRERFFASLFGVGSLGVGGLAVFATANQAGSAVLLIIGAAFLLMGVQGTALVRLGGSGHSIELAHRQLEIIEHTEKARNPAVAAGIFEGAAIADPRLLDSPMFSKRLNESKVDLALENLGYSVSRNPTADGPDLTVRNAAGQAAEVEVKYQRLSKNDLDGVPESDRQLARRIIVTSKPLSPNGEHYTGARVTGQADVVVWRNDVDSPRFEQALAQALDQALADGSAE